MLFFSIFLTGFTLGIFATLKIFSPETQEEAWDPQAFPQVQSATDRSLSTQKQPQVASN